MHSQRNHVSIFDRRGQKPGRGRTQLGKASSGSRGATYGRRNESSSHIDEGRPSVSTLFNKICMLRVHEEAFSSNDLVLNPLFFPGIQIGDVVAIKPVPDGEDGEAASPRGSLDNDITTAAHSGDAVAGSAKGMGSATTSASKVGVASASSTQADEATEGGLSISGIPTAGAATGSAVGGSSGNSDSRTTDRGFRAASRRTDGRYGGTGSRTASSVFLPGRPQQSTNTPRGPNRWAGSSDETAAGSGDKGSTQQEGDEAKLQADPHREILLQVGEVRRDMQQIQASMSNVVARTLWGEYQTSQRVAVRKIDLADSAERDAIRADFVEIAFRDQYVGRSDMWRLWRNLAQRVVHNNKPTNTEGLVRASVRRIYKNKREVACGFIDSSTQPIFRSESGRFIIFIQMTEEMWAYQEDGHLCFEKAVNGFLAELFRRWNVKQLNHMVTIVMFSRWFYEERDNLLFQDLAYDEERGRYYRDYYKVIADMEVRADWTVFLPELLAEFNTYRRDIQELSTSAGHRLCGDVSKAHQGNILEAINLGLNSFSSNYVDRDLARTGLSMVVVTASFGVFDVQKTLLRMTTERMLHLGMRVDIVCLAPRPLFRPHVFRFKSYPVPTEQERRRAQMRKHQAERDARRAKESEMASVSPLAESPGPHGNAPLLTHAASLLKERGSKVIAVSKSDPSVMVDPISLDPLYFNDEEWMAAMRPYLDGPQSHWDGTQPRGSAGGGSALHGAAMSSKGPMADEATDMSIARAFLDEAGMEDAPDTIKELHMSEYPLFDRRKGRRQDDGRVEYSYFAYWVDTGFYNYTEQGSQQAGGFEAACRMGELSMTGVAGYMRRRPSIPDLNLRALSDDQWSAAGGEPNAESPAASGPAARERLLALFAKFDRQAIVGAAESAEHPLATTSGGLSSGGNEGLSTSGLVAAPVQMIGESRTASGNLLPAHGSVVASNASAQWEETARLESGAGSVDSGEAQAPVSSSASPNLRPRQHMRATQSSSVPREVRLGGGARASVFVRGATGRVNPGGSVNQGGTGGSPHQSAAGPSPQQGSPGLGPHHGPRRGPPLGVSGSPQSLEYGRETASESIARQSQLEEQVRTFRGSGSHEAAWGKVGGEFQLTLPGERAEGGGSGRQRAGPRRSVPYNACNPELAPLPVTEQSQRWVFAFPTQAAVSSYTAKWRSLCTPASLPLATDYRAADLEQHYHHYFYHLPTPALRREDVGAAGADGGEFAAFMGDVGAADWATRMMLKEMVYQRLAQGFQLVLRGAVGHTETAGAAAIWLSNGRQVQKLEVQSDGGAATAGVSVTRWERNRPFSMDDARYAFRLWARGSSAGYGAAHARFAYPSDDEVNWNSLDRLVIGYQNTLTRGMRYWRARFVLIPADTLGADTIVTAKGSPHMTRDDLRIANFERFLDHVLRLLRRDERTRLAERFFGALPADVRRTRSLEDLAPSTLLQIRYTTMAAAADAAHMLHAYMGDAVFLAPDAALALRPPASAVAGLGERLNAESPFAQLAQALQHAEAGIPLRNVRWHYAHFRAVFIGSQLVDWVLVNFDGLARRTHAVAAAARLLERGLFCSPHRSGPFVDGFYFYEFTEAALRCRGSPSGVGLSGRAGASPVVDLNGAASTGDSSAGASPSGSRQPSRSASRQLSRPASRQDSAAAADQPRQAQADHPHQSQEDHTYQTAPHGAQPASRLRVRSDSMAGGSQRGGDTRRTLPLQLAQSRVFALDLDPQRRSTRAEQCLVHVDATHSPSACFHVSVNWLNCTTHRIDELVRGWGRTAERCGMRLVEAPRVQDAEAAHSFHQPLRIALAQPPPPATALFDSEWEADFARADPTASRDATLARMVQSLPTYPFERALLEEHDFVLDADADACFPAPALVAREDSAERPAPPHTQYVHRSGAAFVQICAPGRLLWLTNYLHASRQTSARPPPHAPPAAHAHAPRPDAAPAPADAADVAHPPPAHAAPVVCPVVPARGLWPHQCIADDMPPLPDLSTAAADAAVDELGRDPSDAASVDAAVARAAATHRVEQPVEKPVAYSPLPSSDLPADVLRGSFLDACADCNALGMLWHQTIQRYRATWRDLHRLRPSLADPPKGRPMLVDQFADAMWQQREHMPPVA
ncbi:vacuolar membrane-associated protein iml1 [Coemansia guatemalensis]|uniref:Vacuolar membrane-associated protein IML1 n=1 Tax=Coemansia guatemalensis TaxID=2761395 RepID=A0A9W8LUD2_9FUNG|nr:vacuolar membrane-associated protein iml1 [Coemansia guatemalensis]